ncbi:uncharacterized protein LOC112873010 [Panicum hallii]|uniref:uncharacterized protein LOC112873010 n=1 Tax=Panicum hallii TaxID=206008 RepID=UPI000DF4E347|nr:uncharacterized protein LOC112873010 [Panicum hallii]
MLDPVVANVRLTRVLIDGGSSLNLLFMSTLKKMGLYITDMLTPRKVPFYGIVLGNSATPLRSVTLLVTFGTMENYRTEYIKFEIANFESSYHTIPGRPALAKFMVVPHYVYLLLKMLGKSGVLTFYGDLKKSYDCDQEVIEYGSTTRVPDSLSEVLTVTQQLSQSGLEIPTKKANQSKVQTTGDIVLKAIQLQESDSSEVALISMGLSDK